MPTYESPDKMQAALNLLKGAPLDPEMREKVKLLKDKLDAYKYKHTMPAEVKDRLGGDEADHLERLKNIYYPETDGDRSKQAEQAKTQRNEADALAHLQQYHDTAINDGDVPPDKTRLADVDTKYFADTAKHGPIFQEVLFNKSGDKPYAHVSIRRSRKELSELVASDSLQTLYNVAKGGNEEIQDWLSYVSWLSHLPHNQRIDKGRDEAWLGAAVDQLNRLTEDVLGSAAAKATPVRLIKSVSEINRWLKADLSSSGFDRKSRGHGPYGGGPKAPKAPLSPKNNRCHMGKNV